LIVLKSPQEIEEIQEVAQIAKVVMDRTLKWIHPGLTTLQVDKFIASQIKAFHAKSSFLGVGGYEYSSCISINEEIVHGVPSKRKIRNGDIVSFDLGVFKNGWNSDMCRTVAVGTGCTDRFPKNFLSVGWEALGECVKKAIVGNTVGDISSCIQESIEKHGFNVIRDLTGHAIGKELHEDPMIPCFGEPGSGEILRIGMVLCVEVMYMAGLPFLETTGDGWTIVTKDGQVSAMFEDMIALTASGPKYLTR
jgi:methionyl aminopeptidase